MLDLSHYTPAHRAELEELLAAPAWQEVLRSGLVEEVRAEKLSPGKVRSFVDTVVAQLLQCNGARVKDLVASGCRDELSLLDELSRWPQDPHWHPKLAFLGLNVTAECNFKPKCIYCNQPWVEAKVGLEGWKGIIREATEPQDGAQPYIYITGGEPLILQEMIWGDEGLVRWATERGAGVNINTNAVAITPEVALRLIKAGLYRLHISLDTADEALQNYLNGGPHFQEVLQGIYNVQLARELVGVSYPIIHTNCVLTRLNLETFPQLFRFLLEKHKQTADKNDPFFNDLFPHIIPVGGASNAALRPTAEGFRRFYAHVWPEVTRLWEEYQAHLGAPPEKRGTLFGYFSNPFLRVEHEGGLEAYVQASAEGRYGRLALARHCYVAPTQAAFTPDGYQYRCGSHAIRRILPVGHIAEGGVMEHIRTGIQGLSELPDPAFCDGCALATLYINQAVESRLKKEIAAWLAGEARAAATTPQEDISD